MWSYEDFDQVFAAAESKPTENDTKPPQSPPRKPLQKLPRHVSTTKWHWIVMFLAAPLSVLIQSGVPLSFEGISDAQVSSGLQKESQKENRRLAWLSVLTNGIPMLLAPLLVPITKSKSNYYRYFCIASFLFMGLSCLVMSSSQHFDLIYGFAIIYGICSALLLCSLISLLSDYFPPGHPHHIAGTTFFTIGVPLSGITIEPLLLEMTKKVNFQDGFLICASFIVVLGSGVGLLFRPIGSSDIAKKRDSESSSASGSESNVSDDESEIESDEDVQRYISICTLSDFKHKPQIYTWFPTMLIHGYRKYLLLGYQRRILTWVINKNKQYKPNVELILNNTILTETFGSVACLLVFTGIGRFLKGRLNYVHLATSFASIFTCLLVQLLNPTYATIYILNFMMTFANSATEIYYYPASYEILNMDFATGYAMSLFYSGAGSFFSPIASHFLPAEVVVQYLLPMAMVCFTLEGMLHLGTMVILWYKRKHGEYDDI